MSRLSYVGKLVLLSGVSLWLLSMNRTSPASDGIGYTPAQPTRVVVEHSQPNRLPASTMNFGGVVRSEATARCATTVRKFESCMDQRRASSNDNYLAFHARRYKINFASMCPHLDWEWTPEGTAITSRKVLELGAGSVFTSCFAEVSGSQVLFDVWGNYKKDLREPFSELNASRFDLVICQEVIEHIADPNTRDLQGDNDAGSFRAKGILSVLTEARRVLKPGGLLMVTTPNVASHQQVLYTLAGIHPFSNLHHVREMSRHDLEAYMKQAGFGHVRAEFVNTWRPTGPARTEALIEKQMTDLARSLADLLANQPLETIGVDMGRLPSKLDLAHVPRQDNAFYYAMKQW